ncbi:GNAT family N-acetyltransferase [Rhizobium terrae]|uniref:GNAT family N-acetyltransferase n=1 Tax=Rhizobium terrae TaxID=2171756 RepID=UPI000E3C2F21|nr:GNAT family N-acetyltransferase [Rhizobium terrae]
MDIEIKEASAGDVELLLPLFLDMERHYDGDDGVDGMTARARLSEALDGGEGVMLVALDRQALGFASLFQMFPTTGLTSMWYLKELYVSAGARGRRVGELLMCEAAKVVLARGGLRLEFTTERSNLGAQKFYGRLGAAEMPKVFYRLDEAGLSALSEVSHDDLSSTQK